MIIRVAVEQDANQFINIKNQLSFKNVNGTSTKGGFLLGTDIESYQNYIRNDIVLVAEINGKVVGFGIVLKDETVKKSTIWQKRHHAKWTMDIDKYDNQSLCYFEQLAFMPGHSRLVVHLCFQIVLIAFKNHSTMFTTTVYHPIINLAAVPYILKAGGTKIGNINEDYPIIGCIVSDIYKIEKWGFEEQILLAPKYDFLKKSIE